MKGVVFLGDKKAEVRDFPRPEPGPGTAFPSKKRQRLLNCSTKAERAK